MAYTQLIKLGPYPATNDNTYLTLYYEETIDRVSNTSTLKIKVEETGDFTRTNYGTYVEITGQPRWTIVASKTSVKPGTSWEKVFTISHDNSGNASVDIKLFGEFIEAKTEAKTLVLTSIPRNNSFTISPLLLTSGQTATITADRHGTSYTSTITWSNGINSGTITSESTETSWQVSYETLSNGIPVGTSRAVTFTCTTYNGSTQVGDIVTLSLTINTGKIPVSMYDDGNGNVGVTIGERATEPGFNLKVKANVSDLLWDNPSAYVSGTKMGAGSINLGDGWQDKYSFLLIGFTYMGEYPSTGTLLIPVIKNSVSQWHAEQSRSTSYIRVRYFTLTSIGIDYSIGYAFDHHNGQQYSGTDIEGNNGILPAFVIGIR